MNAEYSNFTDEELILRLRAGEQSVENYMLDRYKPMVRRHARMLYLEGADREDLLQEGMIGLFKAIRTFDPEREAHFGTFANQCVMNQMYSAIAAAKRKKHSVLNESLPLFDLEEKDRTPASLTVSDPENIILEEEKAEQIRQLIETLLSPMEKRVLSFYLEGIGYRGIALRLGKNEKSIDNALQRIRAKLREASAELI